MAGRKGEVDLFIIRTVGGQAANPDGLHRRQAGRIKSICALGVADKRPFRFFFIFANAVDLDIHFEQDDVAAGLVLLVALTADFIPLAATDDAGFGLIRFQPGAGLTATLALNASETFAVVMWKSIPTGTTSTTPGVLELTST